MKSIRFYAVNNDLTEVIADVEKKFSLKYILMGVYSRDELDKLPIYNSGNDIPGLSHADYPDSSGCRSYLILKAEDQVKIRKIILKTGGEKYAVDQLFNPESIVLRHGGWWDSEHILFGTLSLVDSNAKSKTILSEFRKFIGKRFVKVNAFSVGFEALAELKKGTRLCVGVKSPVELDLKLSNPAG